MNHLLKCFSLGLPSNPDNAWRQIQDDRSYNTRGYKFNIAFHGGEEKGKKKEKKYISRRVKKIKNKYSKYFIGFIFFS